MNIRDDRREAAIERMADHLLAKGLAAATLRPLAAAAGASDRMLLYYFADKDELLAATLARIATRMIAELDGAIPAQPRLTFAALMERVWAAIGSERLAPFMPLWLDLASGAARGLQPHRDIASQIAVGFLEWIEIRLRPGSDGNPSPLAPLCMAAIEGMYLLRAIGQDPIADLALRELVSRYA